MSVVYYIRFFPGLFTIGCPVLFERNIILIKQRSVSKITSYEQCQQPLLLQPCVYILLFHFFPVSASTSTSIHPTQTKDSRGHNVTGNINLCGM
jgi:hypothetical protein